jgi:hypothetical protein
LIFGAITTDEPPWEFDTTEIPGCGSGTVLFDASGNGNLDAQDNEWGIAYQRTDNTPISSLPKIRSIVIDLGSTTPLYFDDVSFGFGNLAPEKVDDNSGDPGTSQPNFFGLSPSEISVSFSNPPPPFPTPPADRYKILTFEFPDDTSPATFDPCERFRFGVDVRRANGNKQYDGDDIGEFAVRVTVNFDNNTSSTGTFVDTRSNELTCDKTGNDTYCPSSIIIINNIPDLPCPPVPGVGNNPDGQSYVRVGGGGAGKFGVRAQAEAAVPTLCENLFGVALPQFKVKAVTTALFDCNEPSNPRLIRVLPENYNCVAP